MFQCFFLSFLNQARTDSYKHGPLQISHLGYCNTVLVYKNWIKLSVRKYQLSGYNHFHCLDQENYCMYSGSVNSMHYVKHFH